MTCTEDVYARYCLKRLDIPSKNENLNPSLVPGSAFRVDYGQKQPTRVLQHTARPLAPPSTNCSQLGKQVTAKRIPTDGASSMFQNPHVLRTRPHPRYVRHAQGVCGIQVTPLQDVRYEGFNRDPSAWNTEMKARVESTFPNWNEMTGSTSEDGVFAFPRKGMLPTRLGVLQSQPRCLTELTRIRERSTTLKQTPARGGEGLQMMSTSGRDERDLLSEYAVSFRQRQPLKRLLHVGERR